MSRRKGAGPDGIPAWVLKDCSWELAYPLERIFNRSYREQKVPSLWKVGEIRPIPKVKICTKLKDLRPITKTSLIGKLLQKPVKNFMLSQFEDLLDPLQFGFSPGKSTIDALLHLWDFVVKSVDNEKSNEKCVFVYLMDFSSAFDSVTHEAILESLRDLKADEWLLNWVRSFLSDRKHYVKLNAAISSQLDLRAGIPQGEVFSPPAFNISTNSISIMSAIALLIKFADDNTLAHGIRNQSDFNFYKRRASEIYEKALAKGLKFIPEKCKELRIDFSRGRQIANKFPPLIVDGEEIEEVDSAKLLGVILTNDCNWGEQVSKISKSANVMIRDLYRIKRSGLPQDLVNKYVESYIYPALTYGAPVFFHSLRGLDLQDLSKIDKRIARATGTEHRSFEQRCQGICRNTFLKMEKRQDTLIPEPRKSAYDLRPSSIAPAIPLAKTERYKKTFIVAELWNKYHSG